MSRQPYLLLTACGSQGRLCPLRLARFCSALQPMVAHDEQHPCDRWIASASLAAHHMLPTLERVHVGRLLFAQPTHPSALRWAFKVRAPRARSAALHKPYPTVCGALAPNAGL